MVKDRHLTPGLGWRWNKYPMLVMFVIVLVIFAYEAHLFDNLPHFSLFPDRTTTLKVGDVAEYHIAANFYFSNFRYTVLSISGSSVTFRQQAYDFGGNLKDERTLSIDVQNAFHYDVSWAQSDIARSGNPYLPLLCGRTLNIGDVVFYSQITSTFEYNGVHTRVTTIQGRVTQTMVRTYCGLSRTVNVVEVNLTSLVDGYPENWGGTNPISTWYYDVDSGLLCEGLEHYPSPNLPRGTIQTSNVIPEFSNAIPLMLLFAAVPFVVYKARHRKSIEKSV